MDRWRSHLKRCTLPSLWLYGQFKVERYSARLCKHRVAGAQVSHHLRSNPISDQLHPVVPPQELHFRQEPLRTMV